VELRVDSRAIMTERIKCPNMKKRLFLKIEYLINRERT
jgi:hypothetical protein